MEKLEKQKYKFEKKGGITLIALVITIIVLLILAAISITMLTGDNSILNRAVDAKEKTEIALLKEEVQVVVTGRKIDSTAGIPHSNSLETDLKSEIKNAEVKKVNGLEDVCYVTRGDSVITVYEDGDIEEGKLEIWDGKTVSSPEFKKENNIWNWYIYTPSQLKFLADFVNNGNALTEEQKKLIDDEKKYNSDDIKIITDNITETHVTKVFLMNDLDLGGRIGETGTTEELKWENNVANNNVAWTPIGGISVQLMAKFEGNNHTIRGVYVKKTNNYVGLIGNANDINSLTIKNSYIKGVRAVGGIAGWVTTGQVNNCYNINTIVIGTDIYMGGIAGGINSTITGCENSGTITGTRIVGGITGYSGSTITGCKNSGIVNGEGAQVGGIVGYACVIDGCNNNGIVNGEGNQVGGIAGYSSNTIDDCNNEGTVNGKGAQVGGIVGRTSSTIDGCNNTGTIIGIGENVGGISGVSHGMISKCNNIGAITGNSDNVGGITGQIKPGETIKECSNSGTITGKGQNTGGIIAIMPHTNNETNSTVKRCYNNGTIKGIGSVGGLVGRVAGIGGKGTVTECYNKGIITGTTNVGEVIGAETNTTGLNTLNKLFYLKNERGLTAVGGEDDDKEVKKITWVTDDLSYETFKTWITGQ